MISPFNLQNYRGLLKHGLDRGYEFIGFEQVAFEVEAPEEVMKPNTGKCLLRHDVDADLAAAAAMARAESEMGISATYFLMWRSPCYNLMSRSSQKFAEEILALGHRIGLHYDQGFDADRKISPEGTAEQINLQADWLEILLNCNVAAVSFHQPSESILQSNMDCGKRINTYDRARLCDFHYISDSNRVFPVWSGIESRLDAIAEYWPQNIQLLFHPMWWIYDDVTTEEVWHRALKSNRDQMLNQLIATERAYKPRFD